MEYLKTFIFFVVGIYLGLTPILSYYFTHGPACPCHALIKEKSFDKDDVDVN